MTIKTIGPCQAFDVNQPISGAQAAEFKAAGFDACIRYIPRLPSLAKNNLTAPEMAAILGAGLSLSVVQHVSPDNWLPTAALGESYGQFAATYSEQIGYPKGAMIWLDLEMVSPQAKVQDIEDYCHLWFGHVGSFGYVPGLYVGWQTGLTPDRLYSLPYVHYWKGYNADIPIPTRGYQIVQSTQKTLNGITYDPNVIEKDLLGDLPVFVCQ